MIYYRISYFSTISYGTERANLTGDPNVSAGASYGCVFPRYLRYNCSGVVIKKGSDVADLEIGDRVVVFWSCHKKYNIVDASQVVKIEDSATAFQTGAMSFIATFPLAAIRKTNVELGESAMVMGLGILGCTRNSDFTVDYYGKIHAPSITVIGAHTQARPSVESHHGWFTHRDDLKAVLKLCSAGRLCLESLIEKTHTPEECPEVCCTSSVAT